MEDAFTPKPNYVDIVKLIRSIQRAEGNIELLLSEGDTL